MKYNGYRLRVSCAAWEQVDLLSDYWDFVAEKVGREQIVGLGYGWENDYFNYALGVIDNEEILARLKEIDFGESQFRPEYVEIDLPELVEWKVYVGAADKLQEIYEQQVACYDRKYDYELEYFDDKGGAKILIHYLK